MSKLRTPRSIQLSSVASWYKLYSKDVLRGFIEASDGRAKDARISGFPTDDGGFLLRIRWGENTALIAAMSSHGFWNMHLVPDLPNSCKSYSLHTLVTQDEHAVFNERSWSYTMAAITYLSAKADSVGRRIWFGIGSDLTDVWLVVGRFIAKIEQKQHAHNDGVSFLIQRGWRKEGDCLVMPGLKAARIRVVAGACGYVVDQEQPLPLGELGAFLERFPKT